MKHFASPQFWELYNNLPPAVRKSADKNLALLKNDATHPSLHLKKVGRYWSVRIGRKYRALSVEVEDGLIWFWIGTHSDYDKMIDS